MIDYTKNDLIDECLVRFYETFEHTLDTADYVPQKYNDKILAYIFKNMKRQFKRIDRECKRCQQAARKAAKLEKLNRGQGTSIDTAVNDLIR